MATQAERTAATRERLLDATIATLLERGYRGTSTPEICRRAGVSRGAQLHHYPTKEALVAAAVDHLLQRRVSELASRLGSTERAAGAPPVLDLSDAAAALWSVYTGDTFYAWLELVVVARTDEELRKLVAALDARLVARAEKMCQRFLLPHVEDAKTITATTRLILSLFDGLATHRILSRDDAGAKNALRIAAKAGLFTPATGASRADA
ncbi:MAG: TetR/AcrR family transcriptional regulator [Deltaproteobacteria bacterium]|nr:TetR/AcrR family transcriptional regulator [Deltaproteobacteria bacterium]